MSISFKKALFVLAMAFGLQSCSQTYTDNPSFPGEGRTIRVVSVSDGSKTTFTQKENGAYPTLWTTSRNVGFSVNGSSMVTATPQLIADGKDAAFDVTLPATPSSGTLYGFSPARLGASGGFDSASSVTIPSQQRPLSDSCDESAQLLMGSCIYDASAREHAMKFHHIASYGRMTIKGLSGSIASVYVTFPMEVVGQNCSVSLADGTISGMSSRTIWMDGTNVQNGIFWFGIAPVGTLSAGKLTVRAMMSDGRAYTRSIDLSSKNIGFNKGRVTSFSVDMSGASLTYIFRKTTTVKSAEKYLLVANKCAMTLPSGKTYGYPGYTEVEPKDDVITMNTLESAFAISSSGSGYTICSESGNYLYQTAEYNSFNWGAAPTEGQYWNISIASNGDATIKNVAKNKYIQLRTGYKSFGSYSSKQSDGVLPVLYALDKGAEYHEGDLSEATTPGTTPDPGPDPTPTEGPAMGLGWMELPAVSSTDYGYFKLMMNYNGSSFRNYSYCYDYTNLVSYWVAYPLNKSLRGSGSRTDNWGYDPNIPQSKQQNVSSSYKTSGFDRGHQCPSADRLTNNAANTQTFYGPNMTPQLSNFNQGIWARFESTVRNWGDNSDTLYVVTGCTLAANSLSGTEGAIGGFAYDKSNNKVAVPTGYYKAVLRYSKNSTVGFSGYAACAVYLEHKAFGSASVTKSDSISIDELEEITGLNFFVNLPKAIGEEEAKKVEAQQPQYVSFWW